MKKRWIISFLLVLVIFVEATAVPVRLQAAPTFTSALKERFVQAVIHFSGSEYDYTLYALHDFDSDGIPELLMGMPSATNSLFAAYNVLKYDFGNDRFISVGGILESRYLMKDRYSNAIIGFYQNSSNGANVKIYRNYYIANGNLSRNTQLVYTSANTMIDGMQYPQGYYRNDSVISKDTFDQEEVNYRGSYDELIVHDWAAFSYEAASITINSWRPANISKRPITFSNSDKFTKVWQEPMYKLINDKLGPANTKVDEWSLDPSVRKENYRRFALHDLDGDSVPEVLLAVKRNEKLSFDVYKYWNGEMRFIGSFDAYSKYLAKVTGSTSIFAFNPHGNDFHKQTANRLSIQNNALKNDTLVIMMQKGNKNVYQATDRNGRNLVNVSFSSYVSSLNNYATNYAAIKTFDMEMVPPSAALIMYIKTRGFTLQ